MLWYAIGLGHAEVGHLVIDDLWGGLQYGLDDYSTPSRRRKVEGRSTIAVTYAAIATRQGNCGGATV